MSNIPLDAAAMELPDTEAEELAAKHGISVDEAKRHIREQGHGNAAKDGAAEASKRDAAS